MIIILTIIAPRINVNNLSRYTAAWPIDVHIYSNGVDMFYKWPTASCFQRREFDIDGWPSLHAPGSRAIHARHRVTNTP